MFFACFFRKRLTCKLITGGIACESHRNVPLLPAHVFDCRLEKPASFRHALRKLDSQLFRQKKHQEAKRAICNPRNSKNKNNKQPRSSNETKRKERKKTTVLRNYASPISFGSSQMSAKQRTLCSNILENRFVAHHRLERRRSERELKREQRTNQTLT